nr:uncharacterized protein LOC119161383 [Rhipicephalus microplus]
MVYHFFKTILSHRVPVCAAMSFFRSPIVSSSLHFTRTFFPSRSLHVISIIMTDLAQQTSIRKPAKLQLRNISASTRNLYILSSTVY